MTSPAVLHITSLLGGGVDRHVRDIARAAPARHLIWHTCDTADVIEIPASGEYLPLEREAIEREPGKLAAWLRAYPLKKFPIIIRNLQKFRAKIAKRSGTPRAASQANFAAPSRPPSCLGETRTVYAA